MSSPHELTAESFGPMAESRAWSTGVKHAGNGEKK
jgi:hypothetical protein